MKVWFANQNSATIKANDSAQRIHCFAALIVRYSRLSLEKRVKEPNEGQSKKYAGTPHKLHLVGLPLSGPHRGEENCRREKASYLEEFTGLVARTRFLVAESAKPTLA